MRTVTSEVGLAQVCTCVIVAPHDPIQQTLALAGVPRSYGLNKENLQYHRSDPYQIDYWFSTANSWCLESRAATVG